MIYRKLSASAGLALASLAAAPASAQVQKLLIDSPIPFVYSRGQNVSVLERDRPEVRAQGLPVLSFRLYPKVDVGLSHTDNVYQTATNKVSDGFVNVAPQLTLQSDWNRNSLRLSGGGSFNRYFKATTRDENGWNLGAVGRLDVGSQSSVDLNASTARIYESLFSGSAVPGFRTPLPYQQTILAARGNYVVGRTRLIAAGDYTDLDFKDVETLAGVEVNQLYRSHKVWRGTGQIEYGISPDTSIYIQAGFTKTEYATTLPSGVANRDSNAYRVIAGLSFDISALLRGSFGLGYTKRDYKSPIYTDTSGLGLEAQIEYFPTQLMTISVTGRRIIEDSTLTGAGGYFNSGGSVRIDHELLRNLLLRASVDYEVDSYAGRNADSKILRLSTGARYMMNRNMYWNLDLSYGDRSNTGALPLPQFDEARGTISVTLQL